MSDLYTALQPLQPGQAVPDSIYTECDLVIPDPDPALIAWGVPGSRDRECGNIIAMPDPFQEAKEQSQ